MSDPWENDPEVGGTAVAPWESDPEVDHPAAPPIADPDALDMNRDLADMARRDRENARFEQQTPAEQENEAMRPVASRVLGSVAGAPFSVTSALARLFTGGVDLPPMMDESGTTYPSIHVPGTSNPLHAALADVVADAGQKEAAGMPAAFGAKPTDPRLTSDIGDSGGGALKMMTPYVGVPLAMADAKTAAYKQNYDEARQVMGYSPEEADKYANEKSNIEVAKLAPTIGAFALGQKAFGLGTRLLPKSAPEFAKEALGLGTALGGNIAGGGLSEMAGQAMSGQPIDPHFFSAQNIATALPFTAHAMMAPRPGVAPEEPLRAPLPPDAMAELSKIVPASSEASTARAAPQESVAPTQTPTFPESPATISAQLDQLKAGTRPAVMIPGFGEVPKRPPGMRQVTTENGTFIFDPSKTSAAEIRQLDAAGRQNEILGLGPESKQDVAATGETPVAVTEREPAPGYVDPTGRDANRGDSKLNYSPEELQQIAQNARDLHPSEVFSQLLDQATQAVKGGTGEEYISRGNHAEEAKILAAEMARRGQSQQMFDKLRIGDQTPDRSEAMSHDMKRLKFFLENANERGTEVKAAVASEGQAPKTAQELEASKTPGNRIDIETPEQVLSGRASESRQGTDVPIEAGRETPGAEGLPAGRPGTESVGSGPGDVSAGGLPEGDRAGARRVRQANELGRRDIQPVITHIIDRGGIRPLSMQEAGAKGRKYAGGEYDSWKDLPKAIKDQLGGKLRPDEVHQSLIDEGILKPNASIDDMYRRIREEHESWQNYRTGNGRRVKSIDEMAEDYYGSSKLSRRLNEEGSITIPTARDVADFGKRIYQKGMDFARWSGEMVRHLGEKVKVYLTDAWNRIRGEHGEIGAVGDLEGFHVSNADFDKFSDEKLGSGMGHSNYTEGHYFTGDEEAARQMKEQIEEKTGQPANISKNRLNVDEEKLIDYNKSVAEQTPFVKKVLRAFGLNADAVGAPRVSMADWINRQGNPRRLKNALMKMGVEGVRYDEPLRRGRNTVVYDPAKIEMLEKNDKPVSGGRLNPESGSILNPFGREKKIREAVEAAHANPDRPEGRELTARPEPGINMSARRPSVEPQIVKESPSAAQAKGEMSESKPSSGSKLAEKAGAVKDAVKDVFKVLAGKNVGEDSPLKATQDALRNRPVKGFISASRNEADNVPGIVGRRASNAIKLRIPNEIDDAAMPFVMESESPEDLRAQLASFQNEPKNPAILRQYRPVIEHAIRDWDRLSGLRGTADALHAEELKQEQEQGVGPKERKNYVMRAMDAPDDGTGRPQTMFGDPGKVGETRYFTKAREYDHLIDAMRDGFDPKSTKLSELVGKRLEWGQKLVQNEAFSQKLQGLKASDGRPIINPVDIDKDTGLPKSGKTPGYTDVDLGNGNILPVHNDYVGLVNALHAVSAVRNTTGLRAMLRAKAFVKHGLLLGDSFHVGRVLLMEASSGGMKASDALSAGLRAHNRGLSILEYSPHDLSLAVQRGEVSPADAAFANAKRPIANALIRNGLSVGAHSDNLSGILHLSENGLRQKSNNWIFQKLTRGAILNTGIAFTERNIKAGMPIEKAAAQAAKDANRMYSNQGNMALIKSKTFHDFSQLLMLAPRWVFGQVAKEARTYGQLAMALPRLAYKGEGFGAPKDGVGLGGAMARSLAAPALGNHAMTGIKGVAAMFAVMQGINLMTRGQPTWKNDEEGRKLDAFIPGIGAHGGWLSPFSTVFEYTHQMMNAMHRNNNNLVKSAAQVASYKADPFLRAAQTAITQKDFAGRDLGGTANSLKEAGKQILPIPIPLQSIMNPNKRGAQLISSVGLKADLEPSATSKMFSYANDDKGGSRQAVEQPKYATLRQALEAHDKEAAVQELGRLLKERSEGQTLSSGVVVNAKDAETALKKQIDPAMNVKVDDDGKVYVKPQKFTGGSIEMEQAFLNNLSPQRQKVLEQARQEGIERARIYQQARIEALRQSLKPR